MLSNAQQWLSSANNAGVQNLWITAQSTHCHIARMTQIPGGKAANMARTALYCLQPRCQSRQ